MRGRRGAELAGGDFQQFVADLLDSTGAQMLLELPKDIAWWIVLHVGGRLWEGMWRWQLAGG